MLAALAIGLGLVALIGVDRQLLSLALLVVLCCVVLAGFVLEVNRRSFDQHLAQLAEGRQSQAFTALVQLLQPVAPLPLLRSWATLPDLALVLVGRVLAQRPTNIVECGSGSSTVLMAYVLKQLGRGRIVSLEHDAPSKAKTEDALREHGLEQYARVVLSPLIETRIGSESFKFYDLTGLSDVDRIDLLFVDGPPSFMQSLARYPALPLFWNKLSPGATVVLDDARRPKEREVARRWRNEFPQAEYDFADTQKGALIVRKSGHDN